MKIKFIVNVGTVDAMGQYGVVMAGQIVDGQIKHLLNYPDKDVFDVVLDRRVVMGVHRLHFQIVSNEPYEPDFAISPSMMRRWIQEDRPDSIWTSIPERG